MAAAIVARSMELGIIFLERSKFDCDDLSLEVCAVSTFFFFHFVCRSPRGNWYLKQQASVAGFNLHDSFSLAAASLVFLISAHLFSMLLSISSADVLPYLINNLL